ncbi:Rrp6 [Drosophila busckii]|uniref:Exosome complex component 10 homolog n=1 Tax=Drosophila busckii TaxID=30019 RepID=A0A0M4EED7_DROBS|nr:exosome component 10 [Drosophila busckii]ALC46341.1 Rrp6 [Drosophila busckii]
MQQPEQAKETDGDVDMPSTSADTPASDEDLISFTTQAFKNVVAATRCCNAFPQGASRTVHLSNPAYGVMLEQQSDRVLNLIGKVLQSEKLRCDIKRRPADEQLEMVQECNDILFERITTNLDLKSGQRRRNQHMVVETQIDVPNPTPSEPVKDNGTPRAGSWNRSSNFTTAVSSPARGIVSARLFTAKNIVRPQTQFKVPVDNSAQNPFMPRLTEKPNSLKPLALLPEYDDSGNVVSYLHPYEFELMKFEPSPKQLQRQQPVMPAPLAQTKLMIVNTVEMLKQALNELLQATHIAIDVEHHSYRTFMGITCLVQMSTRTKDYIFDTLTLRDDMHILNLVLTDPKKLKILHGGDLDIEWLQRDLSLYVVNLFDTHRAAKVLNMARLSLAFLLKHYVDLDVDKSLQLADWRMRPLPQQLIDYARQDTHYLIYVYERMTNDLLQVEQGQPQQLRLVYALSADVCKKRYTKPHIGPDSHLDLVRKTKRAFDNRQLYALQGIFAWRDATARQEDESYGYVLPNHMMLQIAESLPREMQGILACCNPIPPLVRQQLHTLHQIVLKAREQPLIKPVLESSDNVMGAALPLAGAQKDLNSKLHCPHDFAHMEELRDDLPTLLVRSSTGKLLRPEQAAVPPLVPLAMPACALFGKPAKVNAADQLRWQQARQESQTMRLPYKRYLAILPLMQQQKLEQNAREQSELAKRRLCPTASTQQEQQQPAEQPKEQSAEDAFYSLPLREQLKRKFVPSKQAEQATQPKRLKEEMQPSTSNSTAVKEEVVRIPSSDDDDAVIEVPIEKEDPSNVASKKQSRRQQFKAKSRHQAQSSNQPVQLLAKKEVKNFDYSSVDYKQFRGGAKRIGGTEIKQAQRGRNRPNNRNNKQFNKLFTFSNVKQGKK